MFQPKSFLIHVHIKTYFIVEDFGLLFNKPLLPLVLQLLRKGSIDPNELFKHELVTLQLVLC